MNSNSVGWTLEEIAQVVENPKFTSGGLVLRCGCPAHGGEDRNCAFRYGDDGKLLAFCHSQRCDFEDIVAPIRAQLGGPAGDSENGNVRITVGKSSQKSDSKPSTITWELKNADGAVVAVHVRKDKDGEKKISWKRPNGSWGLAGTSTNDLPLYGADIVSRAPVNVPVVVTEGEKAADALRAAGIMGVGTVTGSEGTPSAESLEILRGRKVILWADNDEVGFGHMGRVAEGLSDVAAELLWYEWPGAPEKGDAADHPKPDIVELEASPRWSRAPAIEGRVLLGRAIRNGIDPPTELLPDILLAGKAHNIFAPGGVGKTWVLVWIATELVKRGKKIVVFDLENGFRTYAERFEEIGGDNDRLDQLLYYYPFPVFDKDFYGKMLDELEPDLVMFDSWIGFLAADGRDENESNDISGWAEAYSKPALRRGTAIVVLDHVPHENNDRERGSRRKRDEVDVAWRLAKMTDFDREHMGTLSMSRVKDREGWLPERLTFEVGGDPETGRFTMRRNDELATVQIVHLSKHERSALSVLESFGPAGASTSEWFDKIEATEDNPMSKATLHRARRNLCEKDKIKSVSRGNDIPYVVYASKQLLPMGVSGGVKPPDTPIGTSSDTTNMPPDTPNSPLYSVDKGETTLHSEGVSGVSKVCQTPPDTGASGGVSEDPPLTGERVPSDTPPLRQVPDFDVGGYGATEEERKKKYEEARQKRILEGTDKEGEK